MTGEVVNLRTFRKQKQRDEIEAKAAKNRSKFERSIQTRYLLNIFENVLSAQDSQ